MLHGLASRLTGRALLAPGLAASLIVAMASQAFAVDLPKDSDSLVATIKQAIETNDYERLEEMVLWKDAGKIKRRIVAFQIRRGLGRPIQSISFEDFPEDGLDAAKASGKLQLNMPVTHRVRVVYDEEPINDAGKLPTSVFLVGKRDDVYRIGLVVRKQGLDDDDD